MAVQGHRGRIEELGMNLVTRNIIWTMIVYMK